MTDLQNQIESRIAELDPTVELVALEQPGGDTLRLFIDHPDGVDLGLCERVTAQLAELLEQYSLEVSSPGDDRPLTKPEHFRRYQGRMVRVRTSEAIGGRSNFTGTISDTDGEVVEVAVEDDVVSIPLQRIHRSNLVPEPR